MKRTLRLTSVLLLLCAVAVPVFAARKNAYFRVSNYSSSDIAHVYVAYSNADEWGVDRLRGRVLRNGQSFTVNHLVCSIYDVKIVTKDGSECVWEEVELCAGTTRWRLSDEDLECEGGE